LTRSGQKTKDLRISSSGLITPKLESKSMRKLFKAAMLMLS